ncbi:MAG: RcpC/CpaB family pilus assembly protein [Pseudomonadota bacterium]
MRNIFYLLAALLSFGVGVYYFQQVSTQTATMTKLRLVAEDGLVIEQGTVVDDAFIDRYVVAQPLPQTLEAEFTWALDDNPVTLINIRGRTFGQDVPSGSFLQRAHFFLAPQEAFSRRIDPGNRAFSIKVEEARGVENFINPGARVDVIGTFVKDGDTIYTERLLENAEVMAVGAFDNSGTFRDQENPIYNSVTLQAPAPVVEAYLGMEVRTVGDMTLVLRNPCEDAADCVGATQ